jgi:hypothetical protein
VTGGEGDGNEGCPKRETQVPVNRLILRITPKERRTGRKCELHLRYLILHTFEEETTMEEILVLEVEELEEKVAPNVIWVS